MTLVLAACAALAWARGGPPAGDPWSTEARITDRVELARRAAGRGEVVVLVAGSSTLGWGLDRHTDPDRLSPMLTQYAGGGDTVTVVELTWANLTLAGCASGWPALLSARPKIVVLEDEFVFPPRALDDEEHLWLRPRWSGELPAGELPRLPEDSDRLGADLDGPGRALALRTIEEQRRWGGVVALVRAPRGEGAVAHADPEVARARAEATEALCRAGAICLGGPEPWPDAWFHDRKHLREDYRPRYRRWLMLRLAKLLHQTPKR